MNSTQVQRDRVDKSTIQRSSCVPPLRFIKQTREGIARLLKVGDKARQTFQCDLSINPFSLTSYLATSRDKGLDALFYPSEHTEMI